MPPSVHYQLTIRQSSTQHCWLELLGPEGQRFPADLPYPVVVLALYENWRHRYHQFYQSGLRARVAKTGTLERSAGDRARLLLQAEAELRSAFQAWLRHPHLHDLRVELTHASGHLVAARPPVPPVHWIDLFLICPDLALARLPWEAWELQDEVQPRGQVKLRIARVPTRIGAPQGQSPVLVGSRRRSNRSGRVRILAILGNDRDLNVEADRQAWTQLSSVAQIEVVGWQQGQSAPDPSQLSTQIFTALTDERGWDILFFAGHSQETPLTGGELTIAPGTPLTLSQLAPYLRQALERGLQFALFNSCSGLQIAHSLLELGCSQVAIMREPIRSDVAQRFLMEFVQGLGHYRDVHEALLLACEALKTQQTLAYPSAYLVPSLFRHPETPLFRLEPLGWQHWWRQWQPRRSEAIALTLFGLLSLLLPIQAGLLEQRQLIQALYRHLTHQYPEVESPPVLLVEIDDRSIAQANLEQLNPLDRRYLARLVTQLSALNARVIGLDYVMDYPQAAGDAAIQSALQTAATQDQVRFVLAAVPAPNGSDWLQAPTKLADPASTLQGDAEILAPPYLRLLPQRPDQTLPLPFAYQLLRLAQAAPEQGPWSLTGLRPSQPIPSLPAKVPHHLHPSPLTQVAYSLGQMWLHPLMDVSVPPEQLYQRVPAWQVLDAQPDAPAFQHLRSQVVILAAGGYSAAGIEPGQDSGPVPAAVAYWRWMSHPQDLRTKLTGGEVHAFLFQHYRTQRVITPIPDLWMVGVAVWVGKAIALTLEPQRWRRSPWVLLLLIGGTSLYSIISVQVYLTAAVLWPVVLPVGVVWAYVLPIWMRQRG